MLTHTQQILQSTGLLDKLEPSNRDSLGEKLGEKLEEYLMAAIVDNITEESARELTNKINNDDKDLEEYLKNNVANYQVVLKKAVDDFVVEAEKVL